MVLAAHTRVELLIAGHITFQLTTINPLGSFIPKEDTSTIRNRDTFDNTSNFLEGTDKCLLTVVGEYVLTNREHPANGFVVFLDKLNDTLRSDGRNPIDNVWQRNVSPNRKMVLKCQCNQRVG